jgi:hypothetical protein
MLDQPETSYAQASPAQQLDCLAQLRELKQLTGAADISFTDATTCASHYVLPKSAAKDTKGAESGKKLERFRRTTGNLASRIPLTSPNKPVATICILSARYFPAEEFPVTDLEKAQPARPVATRAAARLALLHPVCHLLGAAPQKPFGQRPKTATAKNCRLITQAARQYCSAMLSESESQSSLTRAASSKRGHAKESPPKALQNAVFAHVRHTLTPYDQLLAQGVPRPVAHAQVLEAVCQILVQWRFRSH